MDIYPAAAELLRDVPVDQPVIGVRLHAANARGAMVRREFSRRNPLCGEGERFARASSTRCSRPGFAISTWPRFPRSERSPAFPGAIMHIMHPVKSRRFIAEAYHDFGVRTFALDTEAELDKIEAVTGGAKDLTLVVRVACPSTYSEIALEGKFGASWSEAPELIRCARQKADTLGISFHPGSQTMNPGGYGQALRSVSQQIVRAATLVDIIDVGGGFPARYPGMEPPALESYMDGNPGGIRPDGGRLLLPALVRAGARARGRSGVADREGGCPPGRHALHQ